MAGPDLETLLEELEALSPHFRSALDPYGTLTVFLEGGFGGDTLLFWLPWEEGARALREASALPFRGRIVLALAPQAGDAAPLGHALATLRPRYLALLGEGRGLTRGFAGFKEVAEGEERLRVPLTDPRPPIVEEVVAPTGLVYREVRLYPAWESPPLDSARPEGAPHLGAAALAAGALPYGVGRGKLGEGLRALLGGLGLWEGER